VVSENLLSVCNGEHYRLVLENLLIVCKGERYRMIPFIGTP
jgi:hypothetical protein